MAPTISLRVRVLTTMTLVLLLVSGLDLTGLERPVRSADNAAAPPSAYPLPHPLLLSPGTTTRVSVASDSTQGNDTSRFPSISADGRTVAFDSWASSLVSDDTNGAADVFVHDRQTGQTTRVSVASDGTQGNNWSLCPSISADGRYVAFSSDANNLVSGDTNDTSDVFVHDRQTGQTTRISVASDGTQGNNSSNQYYSLSISADGRYVAFDSRADNLVSGDTNDTSDVFVHDRQMGQTTRVSVASDGAQGHGESVYSAISTDGRCVAFESCASNLVSGDTNDRWDVFVHDRGITTTWTLMFYFDGDNNLDGTYPPIFNQLEAAANNPNVQVVAVWDRLGPNNSAYYKVQYDSDLNRLAPYTATVNYWPKGELNMGTVGTLVDFVNWARTNYPAQHYALILSNHGNGLGGGMWDNTSSGDHLTVSEIGTALASATLSGTNKIDVLYMDACLMGMIEDAYQVRGYVDYYVASENIQWAYSTPYFQYVSGITTTTTPAQLAALFTTSYANVGDAESAPYTMSAADTSKLSSIVSATNSLAQLLNGQMTTSAITLTTIRSTVQRFEMNGDNVINSSDDYIDLYDFARLVKLNFSDSGTQAAAQGVMDAVTGYILTERHRTGTTGGQTWNLDHSHGVSVFFPSTASSFYKASNYDFAVGAIWPGAANRSLDSNQATIAWGPMLVNYFQTTQPGGPDNPTPPQPLPRRQEYQVYLPLVLRN